MDDIATIRPPGYRDGSGGFSSPFLPSTTSHPIAFANVRAIRTSVPSISNIRPITSCTHTRGASISSGVSRVASIGIRARTRAFCCVCSKVSGRSRVAPDGETRSRTRAIDRRIRRVASFANFARSTPRSTMPSNVTLQHSTFAISRRVIPIRSSHRKTLQAPSLAPRK